MTSDFTKSI